MIKPALYIIDGYRYELVPVFRVTSRHFVRILGAELYGANNCKYYGWWPRENMPLKVVRMVENVARVVFNAGQFEINANGHMRMLPPTNG